MADQVLAYGPDYAFTHSEHKDLAMGIDRIHRVADMAGRLPATQVATEVRRLCEWLAAVLEPHMLWENTVLYRAVERVTGCGLPTRLMRFEHRQIQRGINALDGDARIFRDGVVTHEELCDIRSHLLGLEALLRAHIEREELAVLPMLDVG